MKYSTTLLLACSLAFASAAVIIVSDEALAAEFEDCVELFGGKEEQEAKINREEFDCVLGACKKQAKCATCMGEVLKTCGLTEPEASECFGKGFEKCIRNEEEIMVADGTLPEEVLE